jgi:cyclase
MSSHPVRVIARLDIQNRRLVKGINLEGLRDLGDPMGYISRYLEMGIDEIILFDVNASLYGDVHDYEYLSWVSREINVPLTAGGGINSIEVFEKVLNAGADKVAINTAFIERPDRIREFAEVYGSQAIVVYIEVKKQVLGTFNDGTYRCYTKNGRERTEQVAEEWVKHVQDLGCGEIVLTTVTSEGRGRGFDEEALNRVAAKCLVPLVVSGGFGGLKDLEILNNYHIDGIGIAGEFHYKRVNVTQIKDKLSEIGMTVRR